MTIRVDDLEGDEIRALLRGHVEALRRVSPPESCHVLDLDGLRRPEITFWTIWDGPRLAGCGALKELDPHHGEIKSMHTAATHRRKGVGSRMLRHILREAERRGYRRLSLETGAMEYFAPARTLYSSFGFTRCGPFGAYVDDPNSVFMTRELGVRPRSRATPIRTEARRMPHHDRFVALLRGVNVGRGKRVRMADLRSLMERQGYAGVRTLLNSGNVVFDGARRGTAAHAAALRRAIADGLKVDVPVIVKSRAEIQAIEAENPLVRVATHPSRLFVAFTATRGALAALKPLSALAKPPEAFHLGRHAAYLWCPDGILKSRAAEALLGKQGKEATTRNWATFAKIRDLVKGQDAKSRPASSGIDAYLAGLPAEQRAALERLRRTLRAVVPKAEECISYGVPAFRHEGRMLVWFAAAKSHCSFYPGAVVESLKKELAGFETRKGTVRFQPDRPLPATLIRKLVKARIAKVAAGRR